MTETASNKAKTLERTSRTRGGDAVQVREALERRLASYALAAGAAGVALLASAASAEADIVYTPATIPIKFARFPGSFTPLDLNGDGAPDLSFNGFFDYTSGKAHPTFRWDLFASAQPGNAVILGPLGPGARIGPGEGFVGSGKLAGFLFSASEFNTVVKNYHSGPWGFSSGVLNGFLGLQFQIQGQTHYGWVALTVVNSYFGDGYLNDVVTGYAYETVAKQSIRAGQTSETPEPATLGLLALGSLGIAAWRRRKHGVAKSD